MTRMKIQPEAPAPTDAEELEHTIEWLRLTWPDEWPRGNLGHDSYVRNEGAHMVIQYLEDRLHELTET